MKFLDDLARIIGVAILGIGIPLALVWAVEDGPFFVRSFVTAMSQPSTHRCDAYLINHCVNFPKTGGQ